nr:hypothetical protein [Legionella oakridgensis]
MKIRQLFDSNWHLWKEIRLDARKNSPESFGFSYEEVPWYRTYST